MNRFQLFNKGGIKFHAGRRVVNWCLSAQENIGGIGAVWPDTSLDLIGIYLIKDSVPQLVARDMLVKTIRDIFLRTYYQDLQDYRT